MSLGLVWCGVSICALLSFRGAGSERSNWVLILEETLGQALSTSCVGKSKDFNLDTLLFIKQRARQLS